MLLTGSWNVVLRLIAAVLAGALTLAAGHAHVDDHGQPSAAAPEQSAHERIDAAGHEFEDGGLHDHDQVAHDETAPRLRSVDLPASPVLSGERTLSLPHPAAAAATVSRRPASSPTPVSERTVLQT